MAATIFLSLVYNHVANKGENYIYTTWLTIPHNRCGLVLGTSKYLWNGRRNEYYTNRIKAAVELYNNDKIDFIIVSGDNRKRNYNEPITMYNDLIALGIPRKKIFMDYAGFRTLDSVIRAKEVFGQNQFTIISQPFHNERAVYIARFNGIEAIAYNADEVTGKLTLKVKIRELLARTVAMIDVYTHRQPRFLGEKVVIPTQVEQADPH